MIEYVIKSTVSITLLFLLYLLLLKNIKTFKFNRFYLLFVIIFSFIIPFIQFTTDLNLPVSQNIQNYSSSINNISVQGTIEKEQLNNTLYLHDILFAVYVIISTVLMIRFIFNLYKITRSIKNCKTVNNTLPQIILTANKTLPYSFLNYIILNKTEFEKGKINDSLIIHEQAHCKQYHTIDILLIEVLKIIFWFNPVIWIIKKEILLNHEYLADNKVLKTKNIKDYQKILLNLVFRNNSTYLASNFNYSLTKKRLIMMTKNNSLVKSIVMRIAIVPLVFLLTVTLTFSQKTKSSDSLFNFDNKWWSPIIEKHNIEILAFNNFQDVFEMGSSNSIENRVVTLKDALFIIKTDNDNYTIIKSPLAYHDLDKNIIKGEKGTFETYNISDINLKPRMIIEMKQFKYGIYNSHYEAGEAVFRH